MAPELVSHAGHDKGVDYWALGCLIYEMVAGVTPFLAGDEYETFDAILKGKIFFTSEFETKECKDLISKLCQVRAVKRLGCGANGTKTIMNHAFYKDISFADLEKRIIVPPFVPDIRGPGDTSYFPKMTKQNMDDLKQGKELDIDELDNEFSSY